ncbi:MAG: hypothetical protein M0Z43_13610 [Acidithiobacillus sp.]|nr:hypothetical protein [Acidithiobacillus sp.]
MEYDKKVFMNSQIEKSAGGCTNFLAILKNNGSVGRHMEVNNYHFAKWDKEHFAINVGDINPSLWDYIYQWDVEVSIIPIEKDMFNDI